MSDNKELINILQGIIEEYEERIKKLNTVNNSPVFTHRVKLENLEKDINSLISFDLRIAYDILDELQVDPVEKDAIMRYLKAIQKILILNADEKTSYVIKDSQIEYIKMFIKKAKSLRKKNEEVQKNNFKHSGIITKKITDYKALLSKVEGKDRKAFIDDKDIINSLLSDCPNVKSKKNLLLGIMKYNQEVYSSNYKSDTIPIRMDKLNKNDVISLFKKYGYDFLKLKEAYQEDILNYGNIINMMELFECLESFNIPKFNLEKNGIKLVRILINCNKEIFTNIMNYSIQKGLTPANLMNLIPALIGQTKSKKTNKNTSGEQRQSTPLISGRSEDYVENIDFLESLGFKAEYVYDKCKDILIMNHQKLVDNYNTFCEYGFSFSNADNGGVFNQALSCLLSSNFAEIADQFIEICPEGHRYIRENMSRLNAFSSPHDVALYNIYASYMDHDTDGLYQIPEGPFVNENSDKLRLRGEITRLASTGFASIPYRGIEDDNKREKTGTIEISVENKTIFDKAIKRADDTSESIFDMTENDPALASLDEYIDSSDNIRYNFNGILISKLKVKRIYNILKNYEINDLEDALLYAITYNSIMSQETFDKLKSIIKSRRI